MQKGVGPKAEKLWRELRFPFDCLQKAQELRLEGQTGQEPRRCSGVTREP